MKFFLSSNDPVGFRVSSNIPLNVIRYVKPFAKPTFLSAPQLDIIYQERVAPGFKLRSTTFLVKESCLLGSKIGRPRLTFQTISGEDVACTLDSGEVLSFDSMFLSIVQLNTQPHMFSLRPGVSQFVRLECNRDVLNEYSSLDSFAKRLLDGYDTVTSKSYGDVPINPRFSNIMKEVLTDSFVTPFKEYIFGLRMKEALLSILEQKAALVS